MGATLQSELVGRERETLALVEFLDGLSSGSGGLVLEGEAGIGKSALWLRGCALAAVRGLHVLSARAVEVEAQLSFVGIADLLDGSLAEALGEIPPPQARALEIALRRRDPGHEVVDDHAVAAGFRSVLGVLASRSPVLVAVDDVQWLDRSSARVLGFALRRVREEQIGFVFSRRTGLEEAIPFGGLARLAVGPLDDRELRRVLELNLGHVPPRPLFRRLAAAAAGNPLHALEIARALSTAETAPGTPLPLPESIVETMTSRIAALPRRCRDLCLLAALASEPTPALLRGAMGRSARPALARAEAAQVVRVDDAGVVRFSHPLLALAAQAHADVPGRRRAHGRLATVCPQAEERARHLALAASRADEAVAATVEEAALGARSRGAADAAAELAEIAVALTPKANGSAAGRRRLVLGEYLLVAGDTARARVTLEEAVAGRCSQEVRARALLLLARIVWLQGSSARAVEIGTTALDELDDEALEAEIRTQLAYLCKHDRRLGLEHARRAAAILDRDPAADPCRHARALCAIVVNEADLGLPLSLDLAERALSLQAGRPEPLRVSERVGYLLGTVLWERDELRRGRELLEAALVTAEKEGDESSISRILDQLAQLEVVAGNWEAARRWANGQVGAGERAEQEMERLWGLESLASVDAHEGRLEAAEARACTVLEEARRIDDAMTIGFALRTLGLVMLSKGNLGGAAGTFVEVDEIAERSSVVSPGSFRYDGNYVEVLIDLGELERAEARLDRLADRGRTAASRSTAAIVARCRAVLFAARGELEDALTEAERAVALAAPLEMPFELGRAYLAKGRVHRRRREKRLAKEAFSAASEIFLQLGAQGWLERSRDEARRLGLRPCAPFDLTETETRVSELAAAGLTNPEIAARLFMSRKTVEFNLSKAYRKLEIRGRGQLAARLATPQQSQLN